MMFKRRIRKGRPSAFVLSFVLLKLYTEIIRNGKHKMDNTLRVPIDNSSRRQLEGIIL